MFWEEDHRSKVLFSPYHIKGATCIIPVDVELDHLAEVVPVRFQHCRLYIFFPSPYCALWKEATRCSPHLKSGELCSFLEGGGLHKSSEILLHGKFASFC